MAKKLTENREKFCIKYVECGCGADALREAYDCTRWTNKSIAGKAYELLQNLQIKARINELKEAIAKKHEITAESIVSELEEARLMAAQVNMPAAMVSASMGKAKICGFLVDKKELSGGIYISHEQALDELV